MGCARVSVQECGRAIEKVSQPISWNWIRYRPVTGLELGLGWRWSWGWNWYFDGDVGVMVNGDLRSVKDGGKCLSGGRRVARRWFECKVRS